MKRFSVVPLLVTSLMMSMTVTGAAQDLADGTWTGSMHTPGAPKGIAVTYSVSHSDNQLRIAMATPMGSQSFKNVEFSDGWLTFTWTPGPAVRCRLEPQANGGFAGGCVDDTGGTGRLSMMPPAAQ